MSEISYHGFTQLLQEVLETNPLVIGLVALGSMADIDYPPDRWSDHDFFVITDSGAQEEFRTDLTWLPDNDRMVFWFRETEHGLKVVYESGHLLEFAVFDLSEMHFAKVDRYRVLIDRGDIGSAMQRIAARTAFEAEKAVADDRLVFGQFLTNLMVGVGRYRRGEILSGDEFIKRHALNHLLTLINKYVPSPSGNLLDRLVPSRRFEFVYPELGVELDRILYMAAPEAAAHMLAIAARELHAAMPNYSAGELEHVQLYLKRIKN
jgi:lincosamide nucleotidyltransferase